MPTVLVTRSQPNADSTAASLREAGYRAVIDPLQRIEPTHAVLPALDGVQAVIVTSANAARQLKDLPEALRALPCYAVSDRTAAALAPLGFKTLINGGGDGATLAAHVRRDRKSEAGPILHVCGEELAEEPGNTLATAGFHVIPWVVYRAELSSGLATNTVQQLKNGGIDAVLFFSPRSAALFAEKAAHANLKDACHSMLAVAISPAAARAVRKLPWRRSVAADKPSLASMLACLRKYCPVNEDQVSETETTKTAVKAAAPTAPKIRRGSSASLVWLALLLGVTGASSPWWQHRLQLPGADADLGERVAILENHAPVTTDDALAARLETLEQKISTLAANPAPYAAADIAALQASMSELRDAVSKESTHSADIGGRGVTIAYLRLHEAATGSAPFADALATFCKAAQTDAVRPGCDTLKDAAAIGAATPAMLLQRYNMMQPAAFLAAAAAHAENWWDRIAASLQTIVSVRKTGTGSDGDDRTLRAIEAALTRSDVKEALSLHDTLPTAAQQELKEWHADAERRVMVNQAIEQLGNLLAGLPDRAPEAPAANESVQP